MRSLLSFLLLLVIPASGFQQAFLTASTLTAVKPQVVLPTRALVALQQSSVNSFQNDTVSAVSVAAAQKQQERLDLLTRSTIAGASCVSTWAMVKLASLSIVQASSLQGLIAALFLPAPLATASFCGSFAGMSGQIVNLGQATVLGALCGGVLYRFEQFKLQVGKGGRLGTVAFLANFVYFITVVSSPQRFLVDIMTILRPVTASAVVASVGIAIQTSSSSSSSARATTSNKNTLQPAKLLNLASKAVLLSALLMRLVANSSSSSVATLTKFLSTAATIFAASLTVKKTTPIQGVVMATSVVGLLGSFLPVVSPAAIYLGAFLGMTGLANFGIAQFGQSSLLSAVLLELGLWNGFGGKLGFLSFLCVHFGL